MNTLTTFLIGIIATMGGWFILAPQQPEPVLGAFGDPFLSIQLATSPANGECLTTDGTNNDWASCSAGAGDITGGTSLGTGLNIYDSESGGILRFNSISAGSNVTLSTSTNNNTIVISSTGGSGTFPFDTNTGYVSTTTTLGLLNGLFSTASSTLSSDVFFTNSAQGFAYLGTNKRLNTIASSSVKLSWFNNDAGFGSVGGADTEIQFNDGGAFGGDPTLVFNKTTDQLQFTGDEFYTNLTGAFRVNAASFMLSTPFSGEISYLNTSLVSGGDKTFFFPNKTGIIALTSDVNTKVGTSTVPTVGHLAYWSNAGTPSLLSSVATSSLAVGSSLLTSGTLGSQVGGTNSSLSINTGNTNTWTVLQNFNYSSSTIYSSFKHASTTALTFGGVTGTVWPDFCVTITGSSGLCDGNDGGGAGGSDPFSHFNGVNSATTTSVAIGTTTAQIAQLTVASSTASQLSLSNGAGFFQWVFRSLNNNLYIATTTTSGLSTSTVTALTIDNNGQGIWQRLKSLLSFILPNNTNPDVSTSGETAINTTTASSSLRFYDGTREQALYPEMFPSTIYASSTLDLDGAYGPTGTTTYTLANFARPVTLLSLYCKVTSGTGQARVEIGTGSATSTLLCTTTGTESTTQVTFTQRQNYFISIGTAGTTAEDTLFTISEQIRINAD